MNNSLSIFIIIKIYFLILFKFLHIKRLIKNKNYFYIKNINCENVLKKLLYESFLVQFKNKFIKEKVSQELKKIRCKNF